MSLRTRLPGGKLAVVLVCLLVALGGCYAFLEKNPEDRERADTTTSLTPGSGELPPGITAERVADTDALLSAHREHLAGEGFVYTFVHNQTEREVVDGTGGSPERTIDARGEVRASANLSAHLRRVDREAPVAKETVRWTNGTAGARRVRQNGTTYESYSGSASPRLTHHYLVPQLIDRGRWTVQSREGDRVVLTSEFSSEADDVRRFEGRLVVDSQGRIRRLVVNVTTTGVTERGEERVQVRTNRQFVYDLQRVGNVSVPPPDWLDEASDATADEPG